MKLVGKVDSEARLKRLAEKKRYYEAYDLEQLKLLRAGTRSSETYPDSLVLTTMAVFAFGLIAELLKLTGLGPLLVFVVAILILSGALIYFNIEKARDALAFELIDICIEEKSNRGAVQEKDDII